MNKIIKYILILLCLFTISLFAYDSYRNNLYPTNENTVSADDNIKTVRAELESIKNGKTIIKDFVYPNYIPNNYIKADDVFLSIYEENKYYNEFVEKGEKDIMHLESNLDDYEYSSFLGYFLQDKEEESLSLMFHSEFYNLDDISLKTLQKQGIITPRLLLEHKLSYRAKELTFSNEDIEKAYLVSYDNGFDRVNKVYAFKAIEGSKKYNYVLLSIVSEERSTTEVPLLSEEELIKILNNLKT